MRFGFIFMGRDLETVGPIAKLGEEQGFELIGLVDSPALAFDPYVALTLAALQTERMRLGPGVTNPPRSSSSPQAAPSSAWARATAGSATPGPARPRSARWPRRST